MSAAVRIGHRADVGEARRRASDLARAMGMDDGAVARVALVTTELCTNVVKHAATGSFYVSPGVGSPPAVDVLVTDRGPGIPDLQRAFGDGYSTAGTPGTGIGAVRRQSLWFDVYTQPGQGTVVAARAGPDSRGRETEPGAQIRGYAAPMPGEQVCGDAWAACQADGTTGLLLADGLGHGPEAAIASRRAASVFREAGGASAPADVMDAIHRALGATRGAAVAVARIVPGRRVVTFAGIGNIAASVVGPAGGTTRMVSGNGTAGYAVRSIRDFSYEVPPGSMVILHSDGLRARWDLTAYPGLARRDPALVLGVLLRDFTRGRDDVSVLAARIPEAGAGS